jgi:hypothetical protein
LFADDTALDVRDAWTEPVRRGRSPADVTAEVVGAFGADEPVVWLALADTQWRWGMLEPSVRTRAIELIDSGAALGEWAGSEWEAERRRVLRDLRKRLDRPAPERKKVTPPARFDTEWKTGEVVGYQLTDGRWALLHVIGHDPDYGGRAPICTLLDWADAQLPEAASITKLALRRACANPLPWTEATVARAVQDGSVPAGTTAAHLNAATRLPYPAFTIGAFAKRERPERRLRRTGVRIEPRMHVEHRLAIGVRWRDFDGYLASAFDLPPQDRGGLLFRFALADGDGSG